MVIKLDPVFILDLFEYNPKSVKQLENTFAEFMTILRSNDFDGTTFERGIPDQPFTHLQDAIHFDFYRFVKDPIDFIRASETGKLEKLDKKPKLYLFKAYTKKWY
jgi:hypothetical protein